MDGFMIAFLFFLGTIFLSRWLSDRANKALDQQKKAELVDLFSNTRLASFGILAVIILVFFGSIKFQWVDPFVSYLLYTVAIVTFLVISSLQSVRKLRSANFPEAFIRSFLLSTLVRFIGLIVFFAITGYY